MAKKIAAYNTNSVIGAPIKAAAASTILQGVFVGLDGSGLILPADMRSSAGPVQARGAALQDAQMKDPKGNVLDTIVQGSYTFEGKIAGLSGLTSGATYYLLSGGAIQSTAPASATGDIDQEVGYALDDTTLVIMIGPAVIHA